MKRIAISPRLESLVSESRVEKRNLSEEEYKRQAFVIKQNIKRNFVNKEFERQELTLKQKTTDFLILFCEVCLEQSLTEFYIEQLIGFIKHCYNRGEYFNLLQGIDLTNLDYYFGLDFSKELSSWYVEGNEIIYIIGKNDNLNENNKPYEEMQKFVQAFIKYSKENVLKRHRT